MISNLDSRKPQVFEGFLYARGALYRVKTVVLLVNFISKLYNVLVK